jgi:Na+/H+ antiporter NhaC
MGGAVFGDQCSPISDTTILSSLACGSDLMDHVYTQLPLALTAAGISIALYTAAALFLTG